VAEHPYWQKSRPFLNTEEEEKDYSKDLGLCIFFSIFY